MAFNASTFFDQNVVGTRFDNDLSYPVEGVDMRTGIKWSSEPPHGNHFDAQKVALSRSAQSSAAKPAPPPPRLTLAEVQEWASKVARDINEHAVVVVDAGMVKPNWLDKKEPGFVIHITLGEYQKTVTDRGRDTYEVEREVQRAMERIANRMLRAWKPVKR